MSSAALPQSRKTSRERLRAPIWLLLGRLEYGGIETVQLNLARALQAREHNVRLVVGKRITALRDLPDTTITEIAPGGPLYFPVGLWHALRNGEPEIIFTTSSDVACVVLLMQRMAFHSVRVVVTQHSPLSAPRKHARGLARMKLEVIRLAMRWLIRRAERIVAVSRAVALDMHRELGIDMQRIETIYNPVVTPDFETRMKGAVSWPWPDSDLPTVIFVGRLAPEKRLDLLLDAFRELIRTRPSHLLIVGAGSQENQVRKWLIAHGLTEICELTGFLPDPLPLIARADVLVLPSDFEGFGNVLIEAMACETQVIATDCPSGPAEVLGDGIYGQLVPCGDAAALTRAMHRVLRRQFFVAPELLRRRAEQFTLARSASAYQRIIDSLASP